MKAERQEVLAPAHACAAHEEPPSVRFPQQGWSRPARRLEEILLVCF
jgi:hypothetical protein